MSPILLFLSENWILILCTVVDTVLELVVVPRIINAHSDRPDKVRGYPHLSLFLILICLCKVELHVESYLEDDTDTETETQETVEECSCSKPCTCSSVDDTIPDSSTQLTVESLILSSPIRIISEEELEMLDESELFFLRNGIYALAGRCFSEEYLESYYETYSWYEGTIAPDEFDWSDFNDFQKINVNNIVFYEKKIGIR